MDWHLTSLGIHFKNKNWNLCRRKLLLRVFVCIMLLALVLGYFPISQMQPHEFREYESLSIISPRRLFHAHVCSHYDPRMLSSRCLSCHAQRNIIVVLYNRSRRNVQPPVQRRTQDCCRCLRWLWALLRGNSGWVWITVFSFSAGRCVRKYVSTVGRTRCACRATPKNK